MMPDGGGMAGGMPAAKSNEICVPVSALAITGEGEEQVAPEPGDRVSVQIEGKVSRVEGDNVYLAAEMANGEPMTGMGMAEDMPMEGGEEMGLRRDMRGPIAM